MFCLLSKGSNERKWRFVHLGFKENLRRLFRALLSSNLENSRTHQFYGKLFLLISTNKSRESILCDVWIHQKFGYADTSSQYKEGEIKTGACREIIFTTDVASF